MKILKRLFLQKTEKNQADAVHRVDGDGEMVLVFGADEEERWTDGRTDRYTYGLLLKLTMMMTTVV